LTIRYIVSAENRVALKPLPQDQQFQGWPEKGLFQERCQVLKDNFGNGSDHIEISSVVRAANQGDLFAIGILSEVGMNLGKGLASLMQLFNPEMVILSGMVCEAEQYIITPIKQALNVHCMPQLRENTEVVISELGPDYGRIGAVSMAMEYVFAQPFGLSSKQYQVS
jgi:N-acetylglucosamine repressor